MERCMQKWSIAPSVLHLGTRCSEWLTSTPAALCPGKNNTKSIGQQAGWDPKIIRLRCTEISLLRQEIWLRFPDHSARIIFTILTELTRTHENCGCEGVENKMTACKVKQEWGEEKHNEELEREDDEDVGGSERKIYDRKKQHIWWMSTKTGCITGNEYLPFQSKGHRRGSKNGAHLCDILSSVITYRRNLSQYRYPTWHCKLIISAWRSRRRAQGAGSVILPNIHPLQFVYILMSTCSAACPLQQWLIRIMYR
jgi:hypothetical protein